MVLRVCHSICGDRGRWGGGVLRLPRSSFVIPSGQVEGDELAQAQREDVELHKVTVLKLDGNECPRPSGKLQRFECVCGPSCKYRILGW